MVKAFARQRRCLGVQELGHNSVRVFGDSNAVGYRKLPHGTKKYLVNRLERKFRVDDPIGRTRLTILPSEYEFLQWSKEKVGRSLAETDFAVLVLGTNDITLVRGKAMEWSQDVSDEMIVRKLQTRLRLALSWIRKHTRHTIFVVEPINEMPKRTEQKAIIVAAMEQEVRRFSNAVWLQMDWKDADLQRSQTTLKLDPRHFNCRATRRLATEVEGQIRGRLRK